MLLTLVILVCLPVSAQERNIRIKAVNEPLNEVLVTLRDEYGIMFSFDHQLLSSYRVTADSEFSNPGDALDFLIKGSDSESRKRPLCGNATI